MRIRAGGVLVGAAGDGRDLEWEELTGCGLGCGECLRGEWETWEIFNLGS